MRSSFCCIGFVAACSGPFVPPAAHVSPDGGLVGDGVVSTQRFVVDADQLSVAEGGRVALALSLAANPDVALAVTLESSDPVGAPVSPTSWLFTSADYLRPIAVTIAPRIDANDVSEVTTISIRGAGVQTQIVTVTTEDSTQLDRTGWPAPFSGGVLLDTSVHCRPVTLAASGFLSAFAVFAATGGGKFSMAIYSDRAGQPGTIITQAAIEQPLVDGVNLAPIATATELAAGRYWLCLASRFGSPAVGASATETGPACVLGDPVNQLDFWDPTPQSSCTTEPLENIWITTYQ